MVTKLRVHNCTALGAVLCFVLCACFFPADANAACASKPSNGPFNSSSLFAKSGELRSVEPLQQPAAQVGETDDGPASIVGLWSVTFFVGRSSSVWDQGFEQFHSDGTELNNDNSVPPSLGNVCVGVYKQIAPRTFKLRHVTWNFDTAGNLTGTFQLLVTLTVAPNSNAFTGTYTSDSFDLSGTVIPSAHAEGVLSATRITVD